MRMKPKIIPEFIRQSCPKERHSHRKWNLWCLLGKRRIKNISVKVDLHSRPGDHQDKKGQMRFKGGGLKLHCLLAGTQHALLVWLLCSPDSRMFCATKSVNRRKYPSVSCTLMITLLKAIM